MTVLGEAFGECVSHEGGVVMSGISACTVRPLKVAVFLLSVHFWLDQCLLHMLTFLCTCHRPQLVTAYQRGSEGRAPLLVTLVTNEPT